MGEPFGGITEALETVTSIAERLPNQSDVQSVLRSARQLERTFAQRESIEPAVIRLQSSVSRLSETSAPADRSAHGQHAALVSQLDTAIAERLLPELRRVGFDV